MHSAIDPGLERTKNLLTSGGSKREGEKNTSHKEGRVVTSKQII
jgi:hypothetical protein